MIRTKVIWPPHPHSAGFCITDDPDASTLEQTRAVYDFLRSHGFRTTKAVWAFPPSEPSGIPPTPSSTQRGITLADPHFRDYCADLAREGFEICLHGASAGNNVRQRTIDALNLLRERIGESDTFICHAKNAENIYWEWQMTSRPLIRRLLKRYAGHAAWGELPESPYFWGDQCATRINQIRLLRTRCTDTLLRNPSMPYHDPAKPFVNGWFSATRRPLADCAAASALDALIRRNGLTVLHQYLHRYAHPESLALDPGFVASIDRIATDPRVMTGTVSAIMKRLRQVQGIFAIVDAAGFYLVNTNSEEIDRLQIVTDRPAAFTSDEIRIDSAGSTAILASLPAASITRIRSDEHPVFPRRMTVPREEDGRSRIPLPLGELFVNLSGASWVLPDGRRIEPRSFLLDTHLAGTGTPVISTLPVLEEYRLLFGHAWTVARELLFGKRSLRAQKVLDTSREIPLENHNNW